MQSIEMGSQDGQSPISDSTRRGGDLFGVSAAITTPFGADLSVDTARLCDHAGRLLAEGCSSVTLFGTTGEGASIGADEKRETYHALLRRGVAASEIVLAVGATSVDDAVAQAEVALAAGGRRLLVLPPFYFKDVSDDGLFAWFDAVIGRIGARDPQVLLYHIPQVSGVRVGPALIRRLYDAHGSCILGVKDSAGDWPTTEAFLELGNISVLVGDERHLAAASRMGGAGTISGMANIVPGLLGSILRTGQDDAALTRLITAVAQHPVTPAVKALTGAIREEPGWAAVRPPLRETPAQVTAALTELARELA